VVIITATVCLCVRVCEYVADLLVLPMYPSILSCCHLMSSVSYFDRVIFMASLIVWSTSSPFCLCMRISILVYSLIVHSPSVFVGGMFRNFAVGFLLTGLPLLRGNLETQIRHGIQERSERRQKSRGKVVGLMRFSWKFCVFRLPGSY